MENMRTLFSKLPDIAIITDAYGYILDNNRNISNIPLKKGSQIKSVMPGALDLSEDTYMLGDSVYRKRITPIKRNNHLVGYSIILTDITTISRLYEQRKKVNSELGELIEENVKTNAELREYALQAKALSDYEEQLQLASRIHDDSGHAITAIHMISQMCLSLSKEKPDEFIELIKEGIAICQKAGQGDSAKNCESINDLLAIIKRECRFPIDISIEGEEPSFAKSLYETIDRIVREAYHNTIDHSLADKLFVSVNMSEKKIILDIKDNGNFRGVFEKGFGLGTMEDIVHKTKGEVSFVAEEGKGFGILVVWEREND